MIIYALESSSSNFNKLINKIGSLATVEVFMEEETLLLSVNDCDGILIDLDNDLKKRDKFIKSLRKADEEVPIIVLCNELKDKKLLKHQKSRSFADVYLTYPSDLKTIKAAIEKVLSLESEDDTRTVALEIQKEHSEKSISEKAKLASEKLDNVFASSFFEEYSDREAEEMKKNLNKAKAKESEPVEEFSLDESEINIETDELTEDDELSFGEDESQEDNGLSLNLGDDDLSLSLGAEDDVLDLGDDEDAEPLIDDNAIDLPMSELDLGGEDVEEVIELTPNDELDLDEGLSLPDLSELDLNGEDRGEENDLGLSLDDDSDSGMISLSGDDEGSLSLSDDDTSASQVFDLGKEDEVEDEVEEFNLDDSDDSDDEVKEFNLNDTKGLDDSEDDGAKEFSLGDTEDSDFNLSDESSAMSDLADPMSLAQENEALADTEGLDEFDITRPILQNELDEIMQGDDKSEEVNSSSTDINNEDSEDEATIFGANLLDSLNSDESPSNEFKVEDDNIDDILNDISTRVDEPLDDLETKMREIDVMLKGSGEDNIFGLNDEKSSDEIIEMDMEEDEESFVESDKDTSDDESLLFNNGIDDQVERSDPSFGKSSEQEDIKVRQERHNHSTSAASIEEHKQYVQSHDIELVRLGETIKSLREDRERLVGKIEEIQSEQNTEKNDFLSIQAELDEKKIELAVLKKRNHKQIEDLHFQLDLVNNKKDILSEQNKQYEDGFEKLRREKKVDVNKVRSREKELEEKLELLRTDAEAQIRNRDHKVLDLKRRIDTLEFDIESSHIKERKTVSSQQVLEEKMNNVIKTLRHAIGHLEDESSLEERQRLIKKNLDV